jgi:hypothetical protein
LPAILELLHNNTYFFDCSFGALGSSPTLSFFSISTRFAS